VLDITRDFFWDELFKFIDQKSAQLIAICKLPETSIDVRNRLFGHFVIWACGVQEAKLDLGTGTLLQVPRVFRKFSGADNRLPPLLPGGNAAYVPMRSDFEPVDLVWLIGKYIVEVKVHIAGKAKDTSADFNVCVRKQVGQKVSAI
jgi:hypothetical protein